MLRKYSLTLDDFKKIKLRCNKKKIKFMTSPFDEESLQIVKKLNPEYVKIASGEITNIPLLRSIGKLNKKVIIMSTGMSNFEICSAIKVLVKSGLRKEKISILHCSTEYPAKV